MTCSHPGCPAPATSRGMCNRHYQIAYRAANADRLREARRARRAANPARIAEQRRALRKANHDRFAAADAAYYRANRDRILVDKIAYRDANRDAACALASAWRKAHPGKVIEYAAARRARERHLYVEHVDRVDIWERDAGTCHLCCGPADPGDWHLDHVIPLALGGPHCLDNAAVSHPACNVSKADRLTDETIVSSRFPAALAAYDRFHGAAAATA